VLPPRSTYRDVMLPSGFPRLESLGGLLACSHCRSVLLYRVSRSSGKLPQERQEAPGAPLGVPLYPGSLDLQSVPGGDIECAQYSIYFRWDSCMCYA
jgi:hypothetical protein